MTIICRSVLIVTFLITGLFSASSCRAYLPSDSSPPQLFSGKWDDVSVFRSCLIQSEQHVLNGKNDKSIYHLDLQIADDYLSIKGREQVHYTNREMVSLDSVYFQLFPNLSDGKITISAVSVNGQDIACSYEFQDSAMAVPMPLSLKPGDSVTIQIDFKLDIPTTQAGNYGLFTYTRGIMALDEFYPVIPVYDETGWHVGQLPQNADKTYLDASLYLVRVTAPPDLTLIASGSTIYHERKSDRQVVIFAAGPARDFYLAAGKLLTQISGPIGETKVNSYAFQDLNNGAALALHTALNSLESYGKRLGDYPYTELDIICLPMTAGALGIEYPGVAGISLDIYNNNQYLESAVAHEVGHQWFYNMVGNDQINQPWLDEALVQYITGLYFLDMYGQTGWQGYKDSWVNRWNRVNLSDIPIGMPAGYYKGKEYSAIIYGRGPLFIDALQQEMGSDVFNQFLNAYASNKKWEIGSADYFKQLAETECLCDLTPLFNNWLFPR